LNAGWASSIVLHYWSWVDRYQSRVTITSHVYTETGRQFRHAGPLVVVLEQSFGFAYWCNSRTFSSSDVAGASDALLIDVSAGK